MKKNDEIFLHKIDEIADLLIHTQIQDIGLYNGKAGISLFLFYYARFKNSIAIHQHASDLLDDLFNQIEATPQPPFSLCSGIAGVGWMVDHLCRKEFIEGNPDDMLSGIDEYLYKVALDELNHLRFDFMHGAMGIAFYFVKRNRQDYLRHLVQSLASIAVTDGDGVKWKSVINHTDGTLGFNIALSHGSSSIALVLCKILQIMQEDNAVKSLLHQTITYILNQEIPVKQYGSYFPGFSIESQPMLHKTRLAWCYGDLGVALAIWQSGIALQNQSWIEKGMEVLLHAASKRGLAANMVRDAGICHGSAGIAQIFDRLHRKTNRTEFRDAANYWAVVTPKLATFADGLAGYKAWRTEEYGGWQPFENLLEGIAGIGLSLSSFVMPEDPAWDECFLLS